MQTEFLVRGKWPSVGRATTTLLTRPGVRVVGNSSIPGCRPRITAPSHHKGLKCCMAGVLPQGYYIYTGQGQADPGGLALDMKFLDINLGN